MLAHSELLMICVKLKNTNYGKIFATSECAHVMENISRICFVDVNFIVSYTCYFDFYRSLVGRN